MQPKNDCVTEDLLLIGSEGFSKNYYLNLEKIFSLNKELAKHLSNNYGTRAEIVAQIANEKNMFTFLNENYPYIEAEVVYSCNYEYAQTAVDILARRMRLAFIDCKTTAIVLPRVIEIMSKELNWSVERQKTELKNSLDFLKEMGIDVV